jgi:hypothetical protein
MTVKSVKYGMDKKGRGFGGWSGCDDDEINLAKTKNKNKTINRKSRKNHCTPCNQANRITPPAETYRKINKHTFFTNPPAANAEIQRLHPLNGERCL